MANKAFFHRSRWHGRLERCLWVECRRGTKDTNVNAARRRPFSDWHHKYTFIHLGSERSRTSPITRLLVIEDECKIRDAPGL